jgi:hypothetical protein
VRVKPAIPGTIIRDPHTKRALPDEGGEVPENSFWVRRLRDGDVVHVSAPEPPAAKPAPIEDRMVRGATTRKSEDR